MVILLKGTGYRKNIMQDSVYARHKDYPHDTLRITKREFLNFAEPYTLINMNNNIYLRPNINRHNLFDQLISYNW